MRSSIFRHNARTYWDVYNAYTQAYPGKPTFLFEDQSALFEKVSELTNAIATDIINPFTRESAYGFASRCSYTPVEADGCTVEMTITLNSAMSKSLSAGYQLGGISSSTGELVVFELTEYASSGGTDTITASAKQKRTYSNIAIGTIDRQTEYMDYPIDGYTKIIKDSISLVIDSLTWIRVDNFDNSVSTDRHFMLVYQSSGKCRVRFGNGTYGMLPALNKTMYATFEVTKGASGLMEAGEINLNTGRDSDIQSVTNASATSGGNDAESVASIVRNSVAKMRQKDIVWTEEDLELAAKEASSSVCKALGKGGVGEATVYIVPTGGGTPSTALKTAVDAYVTALTQFGLMPITVSDPTYVPVSITASITVRAGFTDTKVQNLVEFALTLITCAYDSQIIDHFNDYGIDSCRTSVINVLWSWAFDEDDNEALEFIINKWVDMLGSREYREFGQALEVGNIWQMGDSLYPYGVDIFSLTSPTANTSADDDEIISTGTITVSI